MKQTIDREEIIKTLSEIETSINNIINYFDYIDSLPIQAKQQLTASITSEEKRLNLLLANKTAYCKMLSKTITKPVGPIGQATGNNVQFRTYNGYFIK